MTAVASTRSFLSKSAIYAIGDLLTKASRFLLTPLYIFALTKADVGKLAILQSISLAAFAVLTMGMGFATRRFHVDNEATIDDANTLVSTLFWARNFAAILPFFLLCGIAWFYAGSTATSIEFDLIVVVLLTGFFRAGLNVYESALLVREQAVRYRVLTFSQFASVTAAIFIAVLVLKKGVAGAVIADCVVSGLWFVGVSALITRQSRPKFRSVDWTAIRQYCTPIVPHALFMWGLAVSDRLLLSLNVPEEQVAVYDVGYLIASLVGVFANAMRAAWLPQFFRNAHTAEGRTRYGDTAKTYFGLVGLSAAAIALFAPEILSVIANAEYAEAGSIVRIVVIGIVFMTLFIAANQPLLFAGATRVVAFASGIGITTNVISNLILIPKMGIQGAAVSTVVAYGTMAALTLFLTQRRFAVTWQYRRLATLSVATVAVGFIGCMMPQQLVGTIVRVALLGLLAVIVKQIVGLRAGTV